MCGEVGGGPALLTYLDTVQQRELAAVQKDRKGVHMEELVR